MVDSIMCGIATVMVDANMVIVEVGFPEAHKMAQNRPPPGAVLIFHSGSGDNGPETVSISELQHVLGRPPFADIAVDNPFISRRHAEISYLDDSYSIRDLGSKNGTFVDGKRLGKEPVELTGSEIIELGQGQVVATFGLGSNTMTLPDPSVIGTRRNMTAEPDQPASGIYVNSGRRDVLIEGDLVTPPLSRKEFDILAFLYERAGEACSKDDIATQGWPERETGEVSDQEISQCVHRIRRRIEQDPSAPKYIRSIRGFGYRLVTN